MNALLPTNCVPMAVAVVCLDCECFWDIRRVTCPNCASPHFMPLETWLYTTKEAV